MTYLITEMWESLINNWPDQVFVDVLCGANVRINGVFVLTELSSETQMLEEAKQKLSSLLFPNHVVVLRVLFLQHLEEQRNVDLELHVKKKIDEDRHVGEKRESDLSEFIIVGVDIMKAFNYMSRGTQDPTRVDWVKQLHGDLSARHRLHINWHHWLVCNKNTYRSQKETWVQILSSRWDQFPSITDERLSGRHDIPRGTQAPGFIFLDKLDAT